MQRLLIALTTLLTVFVAQAHDYRAGKIVIEHPWSRPAPAGMPMGVAYFTLTSGSDRDDALISATTPVAERVEFHQTTLVDGISRMRPLAQIQVPAGGKVQVEPGGIHLMLVGLRQALESGQQVPLTLNFRVAGSVQVMLAVVPQ